MIKQIATISIMAFATLLSSPGAEAEKIVIMHTNDTHSQIDPGSDGMGGLARRKVLIDSIRSTNQHTILIDAGDAVQGTTYFNLYGGEVESKGLNALGYDYAILGNHEFDNGMEALARYLSNTDAQFISTNYDLSGTPLDSLVSRYRIVDIAGKKIGLIGLNVDPAGIIDPAKSQGVKYQDVYRAANSTAWHLKHNEGVDYVVAISHIGYHYDETPDDLDVAEGGNDIDLIIGGHSHTTIKPGTPDGWRFNTDHKPVIITQTGSTGKYLGVVTIDTDTDSIQASLIPVDSRLDSRIDPAITKMTAPYRHGVDSLKSIVIGKTRIDSNDRSNNGIINFVSAFLADRGRSLVPDGRIDLAVSNRGGVRTGMKRGNVTKGAIMEMLPFNNKVTVLEMKGSDLIESFGINSKMKRVSYDRPVTVTMNGDKAVKATVDGKEISPDATYRVATIDYIAKGGDYMAPMTRGKAIAQSHRIMNEDVMEYISHLPRKTIKDDPTVYFTVK